MTVTAGQQQDVQIPTIDGIKLAGRLFPAGQKGPAVLLLPGVCDSLDDARGLTLTALQSLLASKKCSCPT
jgi:hypothetical protein